jgi:glycosyltransferase 2 family protein
LIIGTAIIVLLFSFIGLGNVWVILSQAEPTYILLALIVTLGVLAVRYIRRVIYLRKINCTMNAKEMAIVLLSGCFFENLGPARIGEFFTPAIIGFRDKIAGAKIFSSILTERTLDLLTGAAIAIIGILMLGINGWIEWLLIFGIAAVVVLAVIMFFMPSLIGKIINKVASCLHFRRGKNSRFGSEFRRMLDNSKNSINYLIKNKKNMAIGLGLALLLWFLNGLRLFFVVKAFGLEIPWLTAIVVVIFTIMLSVASVIPFGYGTAELSMVLILTSLSNQYTASSALAIALIDRLLAIWLIVGIGAVTSLQLYKIKNRTSFAEGNNLF